MEDKIKVLKEDEFLFRILIPSGSEFDDLMGLYKLSGRLPATVKTIAFKESSPLNKIYCIATNHSDFTAIEGNLNVKTEIM